MIDVAAVRADTPACETLLHFNNAGASLMPDPVYRAVVDHLTLEQEIGGYEAAARASEALQGFYTALAGLLGAKPREIAYVENATRAWDMAFYALPLCEGERIITHGSEYASNYLAFLQQAKRRGLEIDIAPSDASGQIDVEAMRAMIGAKTRLIAITHVPTQGGLVNPAAQVGQVAREHGLLYLLDACQSAGQIDLNVKEIGCHILSGTGRKFLRGPRGTGFLYVSDEIVETLEPPFVDLLAATWNDTGSYTLAEGALRFENWESYIAGRLGLAEAVRYATRLGLPAIEKRVTALGAALREGLSKIEGVMVRDLGAKRCGIVSFDKAGEEPAVLAARLGRKSINISTSTAAYARLDLAARGLSSVARASLHYYNTDAEIERFCAAVQDA